jgi:23S rRNA (adenine1618-N6)-methyltransferase
MTNPPFYASEAEMLHSAKAKQRPPNSACTGAAVEMICPGGEVAFAKKLIDESASPLAKDKVQWFTTMLGKLASVGAVVEAVAEKGCDNWAVTEFVQGQKTRRWAVGWSWGDRRPEVRVARGVEGVGVERRWLPFPSEFVFEVRMGEGEGGGENMGLEEVGGRIDREVEALRLKWQWKKGIAQGLGMAERDVWSRKARRRNGDGAGVGQGEEMDEDGDAALVFKISLSPAREGGRGGSVSVRWLQGRDSVLFESFCGWLKRKGGSR